MKKYFFKQKRLFAASTIFAGICLVLFFVVHDSTSKFIPTRAIVATDTNPTYLNFWPIVAQAWNRIGIKPTLALIAEDDVEVDESVGDVIRFKPIPGVSSSLYAQTIRILIPSFFEDEICIVSDIDLIPISRSYYVDRVKDLEDDAFVVYRDKAYGSKINWWPMCYVAAKGSVFKEIYGVKSVHDIPAIIKYWSKLGFGWHTDEIVMTHLLRKWHNFEDKCVKLESLFGPDRISKGGRIDRSSWKYDIDTLVNEDYYVDCHSLRPYNKYKEDIDVLLGHLGLNC